MLATPRTFSALAGVGAVDCLSRFVRRSLDLTLIELKLKAALNP